MDLAKPGPGEAIDGDREIMGASKRPPIRGKLKQCTRPLSQRDRLALANPPQAGLVPCFIRAAICWRPIGTTIAPKAKGIPPEQLQR